MKTASYLRIFIATATMTAFACSDPMEPIIGQIPTHGEYHTGVSTWVRNDDGKFMGLVTQTPDTDLSTVAVLVVKDGKRISIHQQYDEYSKLSALATHGEYFWASYRNSVLLLNYIGKTAESEPPYPLDVIIKY